MPDLAIDTSSYPKPVAPTNPLDTMSKITSIQQGQQNLQLQGQALQSGALGIDKQKLDLINQRFEDMSRGLAGIATDPNFNEDKLRRFFIDQVKAQRMPAEMAAQTISSFPPTQGMKPDQAKAALKQWVQEKLIHASTINDAIHHYAGTAADKSDQANTYQGVQQSPLNGGGFTPKTQMPIQPPPTQPTVNNNPQSPNYLQPGIVGASAPSGVYPAQSQNNLPVSSPAVPTPRPRPGLPLATGPTGPTENKGSEFDNRYDAAFPNKIVTGAPPGVSGAIQKVGEQSGQDYASALTRAKNLQADLYPANRVLDILHEEGPQAFGVGTDKLNTLKNAIVTWFPNVDPKTIQSVANFGEAKKQLVQLARSNGNSGTNDQLAAAFEGSPNTSMTGATIDSVVKSIVALRKMEHAQTLMFAKTGLPDSDYSKWIARNQNQFDPRAFGFDMMDRSKQDKLLDSMTEKDSDSSEMKAAKARAYTKFKKTVQFAHDSNLIGNNE